MLAAFLMAFPALFTIVNPLSGALIFGGATHALDDALRLQLAKLVGIYSLAVMLAALLGGSYVLALFGISLSALRIGGGLTVALFAWGLLNAPERREVKKQRSLPDHRAETARDMAFFPLTMPFTTGPGTIAVAIAIGAGHPRQDALWFFVGAALAAVAVSITITVLFASSKFISRLLGQSGTRVVTRLTGFLLLCLGVQLMITGVTEVLQPLAQP